LPLTALLRLGGGAVSELAVVGDTPSDVESGLRAGAGLVAGVTTGMSSRDTLVQAGAPFVLDAVGELVQLLGLGGEAWPEPPPRELRENGPASPS
jgi:phosphoglycolate phosphatase-like HAD superfamily hydrolase